jgi:sterol desaturase/sphingolipid hydroxylase (fatty acid hydroxylase superfamily)
VTGLLGAADASGDAHGGGAPWPIVGAALLPSILDVAEALVHKARHRIPMARAHHDHLYQRLVKATGSHGAVALRYGALALVAVVVVGPLAQTAGAAVAAGVGALVLAAHWVQGVRRTRGVPRLTRA